MPRRGSERSAARSRDFPGRVECGFDDRRRAIGDDLYQRVQGLGGVDGDVGGLRQGVDFGERQEAQGAVGKLRRRVQLGGEGDIVAAAGKVLDEVR